MPLNITPGRGTKPRSSTQSPLKPSATSRARITKNASPSNASPRHPSSSTTTTATTTTITSPLPDHGLLTHLPSPVPAADTLALLHHITTTMFTPLPPRRTGLSSTATSRLLTFRSRLPPLASLAHLRALTPSPTSLERALAHLLRTGDLRRIALPGRGAGAPSLGNAFVLTAAWVDAVRAHPDLDDPLRDKYLALLAACPGETRADLRTADLARGDVARLLDAGFLTRGHGRPGAGSFLRLGLPGAGSKPGTAPVMSGGPETVGGGYRPEGSGGGTPADGDDVYTFALPNVGPYLKFVQGAREHLVGLLGKRGARAREAPMELLRERWDGGVPKEGDEAAERKRERGEHVGPLPGRTKKWRQWHGLRFEWVLEEAFGAGLVECFETGSVGVGVRVR